MSPRCSQGVWQPPLASPSHLDPGVHQALSCCHAVPVAQRDTLGFGVPAPQIHHGQGEMGMVGTEKGTRWKWR